MPLTILYLDDDPGQLELFRELFRLEFDVRTALTAAAASALLAERPASIVFSDQRLVESDGTEFLRAVARDHPSSYRVLLTGAASFGDMLCELTGGIFHAFLAKPWTEDEIRQVIVRGTSHMDLPRQAGGGC